MRHLLMLTLFCLYAINSYSQQFSNGYFINNSDEKTDCLIKSQGFKNPSSIGYKLSEDAPLLTASIDSVKEFGIINQSKFIRSLVKIDRSSENLREMSIEKQPVFNEELLFLKVLIEGKANLYVYEEVGLTRFFYQLDDSPIEQLIYKSYKTQDGQVGTNNAFRQQLLNHLPCPSFNINTFNDLRYSLKEILDLFVEYNTCVTSEYVNYREKRAKGDFNLSIRPGMNLTSFAIDNIVSNQQDVDFGKRFNFRLGVEAEFNLPFNDKRWSIAIEPTYQYFKKDLVEESAMLTDKYYTVSVDYQSIEIPLTLRHYIRIKNNYRIFVNASVITDVLLNSAKIDYNRIDGTKMYSSLAINSRLYYALGGGFQHKRFCLEYRYYMNKNVLSKYHVWLSHYHTSAIIFGYQFLSKKI